MFRRAPTKAPGSEAVEWRPLWALNGLPHATARDLERWLDGLAELTLDAWLRIAEHCDATDQTSLPMTRACVHVERVIADQGLQFTSWLVRDLVETTTHHIRHAANRQPRQVRGRLAVARMAAEWAALATACRPWLAPEDCVLLCAPFTRSPQRRASAAV